MSGSRVVAGSGAAVRPLRERLILCRDRVCRRRTIWVVAIGEHVLLGVPPGEVALLTSAEVHRLRDVLRATVSKLTETQQDGGTGHAAR